MIPGMPEEQSQPDPLIAPETDRPGDGSAVAEEDIQWEPKHPENAPPPEVTGDEAPRDVAAKIEEIPAQHGATVLQSLSTEHAAEVAEYLDPETASRIMAEMDPTLAASVLTDMEAAEASMVLGAMDPDDAVDVLEHVPRETHDAILKEMAFRDAELVRALEQYAPDTAGGIMTPEVTALSEDLTVQEAIEELRRLSEQLEQMFYVYVIDARRHLVGVLSMRDLILANPDRRLARVMNTHVKSVPTSMDREEVAQLFRKFNYLAMPVVDDRNRLVGLITVDDVVRVLEEESTEDVQKMFGAGPDERLTSHWFFSFRTRTPWLVVNLCTALAAASVVTLFSDTIALVPILAGLQTVVSGMGGNASAQAMAVAVRGIALGEVDAKKIRRVLRNQVLIGLSAGLVIGLLAFLAVLVFYGSVGVATIVGIALLFNLVNACVCGVSIPFLMRRLGFDPAQSASIFATTITDCAGFFATLWLAKIAMDWIR